MPIGTLDADAGFFLGSSRAVRTCDVTLFLGFRFHLATVGITRSLSATQNDALRDGSFYFFVSCFSHNIWNELFSDGRGVCL